MARLTRRQLELLAKAAHSQGLRVGIDDLHLCQRMASAGLMLEVRRYIGKPDGWTYVYRITPAGRAHVRRCCEVSDD